MFVRVRRRDMFWSQDEDLLWEPDQGNVPSPEKSWGMPETRPNANLA